MASSISQSEEHLTHPKYRPDIDGLRAIAILSVVGFHAFPGWVKGGFIGVDIFFVISGYLISTIIVGSLERNSFSFVEFYVRRINRLFPALLLVLTACFIFGWFALLADEYKQLGKHIAGGAGFISNYLFWSESGYFDNPAETKPLLHLWSLGIEEQFYIVWPLLLWFSWKQRLNLLTITTVVVLISFALNISKVTTDAVATFYSPQTRFWELLVGSILAYIMQHKQRIFPKFKHRFDMWRDKIIYANAPEADGRTLRNVQSVLGAVLLTVGVLVTKEKYFPGWWAVLPTLGAVLIISAGTQAWFNRVLSNRVLVWFGLISFPLYLWHWPLLSFARIVESETPSLGVRIAAVIIAVVLAWLTYRLIEKPIRFGNHSKAKTITLFGLMVVVGCVGYNLYKSDGLTFRAGAQLQVINDGDTGHDIFHKYPYKEFYLCTPINIQKEALRWNDSAIRCFQSKKNEPISIAIIGDSHAEHLFIGLAKELHRKNVVYYTKGSRPFINNKEYENIFRRVIADPNVQTIILSAYWNWSRMNGEDLQGIQLAKTVNALTAANKTVYVADDVPNFSFDVEKCKFSRKFSRENACAEDRKIFYEQYQIYYPILQSIVNNNPRARILKMAEYFCDPDSCYMARKGVLFYRDRHHLNVNGSEWLGKRIVEDNPKLAN